MWARRRAKMNSGEHIGGGGIASFVEDLEVDDSKIRTPPPIHCLSNLALGIVPRKYTFVGRFQSSQIRSTSRSLLSASSSYLM